MTEPLALDTLPPLARQLVDLIGERNTFALVHRWGGVKLYVPTAAMVMDAERGPHPIVAAIGLDAALKLASVYAQDVLSVPLCRDALRARRNASWVQRFYAGESPRDIALSEGVTQRRVEQVLSDAGATASQRNMSLFGD